jgi:hypothetical protein
MKRHLSHVPWTRLRACCLIGLACLLAAILPADVTALGSKKTDQQLYAAARQARQNNDFLTAALNLYAYRERQPDVYLKNRTHQSEVDETLRRLINAVSDDIEIASGARKEGCKAAQVRGSSTNLMPMYLPPYPSACQGRPGPNEVMLYVDFGYSGACVVKPIGRYATAEQIGLPNDSISSLKIGSNVRAVVCEHYNFSGTCSTFFYDDSNLSNDAIGNDRITSVRVERR